MGKHFRLVALWVIIQSGVTACAWMQPPTQSPPPPLTAPAEPIVVPTAQPEPPVVPARPAVAEDVVIVSGILSELSKAMQVGGELLRREIATTHAAWGKGKTDAIRLKLAGLIAFASAGPADDARALSLLEPWMGKSVEHTAFKAVADLITIPLLEKQKYMREEQRKADLQRERTEQLKKELEATQQKLEAMRQLERSLSRRRAQ